MSRMRFTSLSALAFLIILSACWATAQQPTSTNPQAEVPKETIYKLIKDLGSKDFKVRDHATKRLLEIEEAAPALQEAAKSEDAEVAQRAKAILDRFAIRKRERNTRFSLDRINGHGFGFEAFIDRMVEDKNFSTQEHWGDVITLTKQIMSKTTKTRRRGVYIPIENGANYPIKRATNITKRSEAEKHRILGPSLRSEVPITSSLVLSSGRIATVEAPAFGSILLSGGNVAIDGPVTDCLIIASQEVAISGPVENSIIIAGGTIRMAAPASHTEILQKQPIVFDLIRFFAPALIGLEIGEKNGKVIIHKVVPGKPFAHAGIQTGDGVVSINGAPIKKLADCHTSLRQSLVRKEAKLIVQRGESLITVVVPMNPSR